MTFVESIQTVLTKKYADFSGTASRSEFWWYILFVFVASIILNMIHQYLGIIFSLATFVPSIAVAARRLHDTDRTGWLQLLGLIPLIGAIILIVFYVQEGKANRYGAPSGAVV